MLCDWHCYTGQTTDLSNSRADLVFLKRMWVQSKPPKYFLARSKSVSLLSAAVKSDVSRCFLRKVTQSGTIFIWKWENPDSWCDKNSCFSHWYCKVSIMWKQMEMKLKYMQSQSNITVLQKCLFKPAFTNCGPLGGSAINFKPKKKKRHIINF